MKTLILKDFADKKVDHIRDYESQGWEFVYCHDDEVIFDYYTHCCNRIKDIRTTMIFVKEGVGKTLLDIFTEAFIEKRIEEFKGSSELYKEKTGTVSCYETYKQIKRGMGGSLLSEQEYYELTNSYYERALRSAATTPRVAEIFEFENE